MKISTFTCVIICFMLPTAKSFEDDDHNCLWTGCTHPEVIHIYQSKLCTDYQVSESVHLSAPAIAITMQYENTERALYYPDTRYISLTNIIRTKNILSWPTFCKKLKNIFLLFVPVVHVLHDPRHSDLRQSHTFGNIDTCRLTLHQNETNMIFSEVHTNDDIQVWCFG